MQALVALGYRPVPLSGRPDEKVVDIGIQRTLDAIRDRRGDVILASHDSDFADGVNVPRVRIIPLDESDPVAFL